MNARRGHVRCVARWISKQRAFGSPKWQLKQILYATLAASSCHAPRPFPPPWSVDDPDTKLGQDCYIVRDANGHALAYVYFDDEPGRRSAAHLLTRDEAWRIAANIAKLAGAAARSPQLSEA